MKKQDVIEKNGKAFTVIAVSDSDVDEGHAEGITHFSIDSNHNLKREGVRTTYSGGIVVALGEADMKDDEMEALRRSEDDNPLAENLKKLEDLVTSTVNDKLPSLAKFLNRKEDEELFCFEYKEVLEFVFEGGKMTAMVDHSRDMYRIRKNLEYGLRDLKSRHDVNSIRHFVKSIMVCEYNEKWVTKR